MTTETGAPAAEQSAAPVELDTEISLEDARSIIDGWSEEDLQKNQNIEGEEQPQEVNEAARRAMAERDSQGRFRSKEQNADPDEPDPGEREIEADETEDDEKHLPAIERPRSWAKELDEEWASYPRAAQERIAKREQERDTAVRRSQNEIAEQRKAFEAEREAVKQLRQQYETRLPDLAKTLEQSLQNEFGDIKDLNDVRKLQMEDPFRFQQWQLRQMELAAAQKEHSEAESKKTQEKQAKWNDYTQAEDKKFSDSLSEKDKGNLKDLMASAPQFLEDKGFSQQELAKMWNENETFRDHRLQLLILDAMKYRDLQNAPKAVAEKKLPPVQKPGSSNRPSAAEADIIALERRLAQTGSEEDGWRLLEARMKRAR